MFVIIIEGKWVLCIFCIIYEFKKKNKINIFWVDVFLGGNIILKFVLGIFVYDVLFYLCFDWKY